MATPETAARDYLRRVEELLSDLESDDRESVLADLAEQLADIEDVAPVDRLGVPEEFVAEYRRSAGLPAPSPVASTRPVDLVSAVILALAVMIMLSFGAQLLLGPMILVLGWFLARSSSRSLRLAWVVVAGLLAGEITYLLLAGSTWSPPWFTVFGALAAAVLVARVYQQTTRDSGSANLAMAAVLVGAIALFNIWWLGPADEGLFLLALATTAVVAIVVWLLVLDRRHAD